MEHIFKTVMRVVCILILILVVQRNSHSAIYTINGTMNGAGEVPPVITSGSATFSATYNDVTNQISFSVNFGSLTGLTSAAHFHGPATPTTNAGVQIGWTSFPLSVISGNYSNTFTLTAAQETQLLGNQWYANIHSSFAPGGEIRLHLFPVLRTLNLTYLIEGFYDNGSNTMVSDAVNANIRNSASPYAIVDAATPTLSSSGTATMTFSNALNATPYYIQVLHRNGLETWNALPVQFTNGSLSYDFTTSATQAYGNNLVLKGSRYCAYSGDPNHDGSVDLSDIVAVFNDALVFLSGYVDTDINGDGFVDLGDIIITFNNAQIFVAVIKP